MNSPDYYQVSLSSSSGTCWRDLIVLSEHRAGSDVCLSLLMLTTHGRGFKITSNDDRIFFRGFSFPHTEWQHNLRYSQIYVSRIDRYVLKAGTTAYFLNQVSCAIHCPDNPDRWLWAGDAAASLFKRMEAGLLITTDDLAGQLERKYRET